MGQILQVIQILCPPLALSWILGILLLVLISRKVPQAKHKDLYILRVGSWMDANLVGRNPVGSTTIEPTTRVGAFVALLRHLFWDRDRDRASRTTRL